MSGLVAVGAIGAVVALSSAPVTAASTTGKAKAATSTAAGVVDVTMGEYAYIISGTLKAGGTIRYRNIGHEAHIVDLGRLKAGKTLAQVNARVVLWVRGEWRQRFGSIAHHLGRRRTAQRQPPHRSRRPPSAGQESSSGATI